ncbi:MAG: 16S rRNA (guanine(966)-N(2))-methyltransferase RsmD [Nitrospirae bacterium]|nr:16S rRNA (guanine(966)-N(2))-methyltransferase RsmD [Nitrospirota bacterium]
MLRIIGGKLKGKLLNVPNGNRIRPTSDKVRESLFNILDTDIITGSRFLDLFAGSGAVGIEALSRGAQFVTFVESDIKHIKILRENLNTCNLFQQSEVISSDIYKLIESLSFKERPFDVVFADPPYNISNIDILLQKITTNVNIPDYGVLVIEHSSRILLAGTMKEFNKYRDYKYGDTTLTVYRKVFGKLEI